jgi:hypothetical protein
MNISRRISYFCLVAGVLLGVQFAVQPCIAQAQTKENATGSALAVSPAIIEKSLTPGETTSFTLNVRNITNSPLPVTSFVRAFTVQSSELEKTDHARLDASQWFTINEPDFILQPNQEHQVTGVIRPPLGVEPGGHYATVFFQPLVVQDEANPSMARISARVGALSFLTVKGKIIEKATLVSPPVSPKLIHPGPIDMTFKVSNTGNVHIMPKGTLNIYDWRGQRVATIDVPVGLILPEATKEYTIPWTTPSAFGKYRAELSLEYGVKHIRLQSTTIIFWAVPWQEMLAGSVVFLVGSLFVFKTHRRWSRAWDVLRANPSRKL